MSYFEYFWLLIDCKGAVMYTQEDYTLATLGIFSNLCSLKKNKRRSVFS